MMFTNVINAEKKEVNFLDCVDGDTIKVEVDGEKMTLRFLAIDTPETVHPTKGVEPFGEEASDYTCEKVKNAKNLSIEYDPNSDIKDKYDRLLAWVFVDDSLLQKELVSLGYAKVAYIYGEYMYTDELLEEEKKAADSKLGIWSLEEYPNDEIIDEVKTPSWIDKTIDKLIDYMDKSIKSWIKSVKKLLKKEINKMLD